SLPHHHELRQGLPQRAQSSSGNSADQEAAGRTTDLTRIDGTAVSGAGWTGSTRCHRDEGTMHGNAGAPGTNRPRALLSYRHPGFLPQFWRVVIVSNSTGWRLKPRGRA